MPSSIEIKHYLKRIGYEATPAADLATLTALHRAHSNSISYENLDVQLGRKLSLDPAASFAKMVERRRGGWCYEMNGLFAWALETIGFRVTRVAGGVGRDVQGDDVVGGHLVLIVDLGEPYVADVGFGDGMVEPMPLKLGSFSQRGLDFSFSEAGGGWWRFHNHPAGGTPTFDFRTDLADVSVLERKCAWLQSDPQSPFVLNAVAQRYRPDGHYTLRGRAFTSVRDGRSEKRMIENADDYADTLERVFDIDLPEARSLWPKIATRHRELFG